MFKTCKNLKSVSLPNGLESIGEDAFFDSGLKCVVFPASVEEIQECAFYEN